MWLPFDPTLLGDPPGGFRYEVVDPTRRVPDSVAAGTVAIAGAVYDLDTGLVDLLT